MAPRPCGARLGGERAPAQRERKGSERRKVFAERNPEGGLRSWPSFRSVPCADDCRCYAGAPLRAFRRSGYVVLQRFRKCVDGVFPAGGSRQVLQSRADHDRSRRGGGRGACGAACASSRRVSPYSGRLALACRFSARRRPQRVVQGHGASRPQAGAACAPPIGYRFEVFAAGRAEAGARKVAEGNPEGGHRGRFLGGSAGCL